MKSEQQNLIVQQLADEFLVFKCITGSTAYGTSGPNSDIDHLGVFIAPPNFRVGLTKIEQCDRKNPDTVIYEIAKYFRLAADCNPNVIELLFTDSVEFIDPIFERVREHRHLFLSKKARHTFSGYAIAQLKRIKGHNKWISNPQQEQSPDLLEHAQLIGADGRPKPGLVMDHLLDTFLVKVSATTFRVYSSPHFSKPPLSEDRMNLQWVDIENARLRGADFVGTLAVQMEAFRQKHRLWKDYWEWKKNRNPARANLEEHHGFDTKHAMHLVRLLRMAKEILIEGKVIIQRPDAEELIAIRNGEFDYEKLVEEAEQADKELEELYEKSTLRDKPDREAINDLLIDVTLEYWRKKGLV